MLLEWNTVATTVYVPIFDLALNAADVLCDGSSKGERAGVAMAQLLDAVDHAKALDNVLPQQAALVRDQVNAIIVKVRRRWPDSLDNKEIVKALDAFSAIVASKAHPLDETE